MNLVFPMYVGNPVLTRKADQRCEEWADDRSIDRRTMRIIGPILTVTSNGISFPLSSTLVLTDWHRISA